MWDPALDERQRRLPAGRSMAPLAGGSRMGWRERFLPPRDTSGTASDAGAFSIPQRCHRRRVPGPGQRVYRRSRRHRCNPGLESSDRGRGRLGLRRHSGLQEYPVRMDVPARTGPATPSQAAEEVSRRDCTARKQASPVLQAVSGYNALVVLGLIVFLLSDLLKVLFELALSRG